MFRSCSICLDFIGSRAPGVGHRGGSKSYVDVPAGPRKSDFLDTNLILNCPISHPSVGPYTKF